MSDFIVEVTQQYEKMGSTYIAMQHQAAVVNPRFIRDWAMNHAKNQFGSFRDKVIVDAGCGSGSHCKKYADEGAARVYGFDPSDFMLSEAKKLGLDESVVQLSHGTFDKIPVEDGVADGLIGFFSIHYSKSLDESYKEIARVLKSGGRLIIVSPHPYHTAKYKKSQIREFEVVESWTYNGTCSMKHPHHGLSNYFSPVFFSLFHLDFVDEFHPFNEDGTEQKDPQSLFFAATKK